MGRTRDLGGSDRPPRRPSGLIPGRCSVAIGIAGSGRVGRSLSRNAIVTRVALLGGAAPLSLAIPAARRSGRSPWMSTAPSPRGAPARSAQDVRGRGAVSRRRLLRRADAVVRRPRRDGWCSSVGEAQSGELPAHVDGRQLYETHNSAVGGDLDLMVDATLATAEKQGSRDGHDGGRTDDRIRLASGEQQVAAWVRARALPSCRRRCGADPV